MAIVGVSMAVGAVGGSVLTFLLLLIIAPKAVTGKDRKGRNTKVQNSSPTKTDRDANIDTMGNDNMSAPKLAHKDDFRPVEDAMSSYYDEIGMPGSREESMSSYYQQLGKSKMGQMGNIEDARSSYYQQLGKSNIGQPGDEEARSSYYQQLEKSKIGQLGDTEEGMSSYYQQLGNPDHPLPSIVRYHSNTS